MEKNIMKVTLSLNGKQYSVQAPSGWVLDPADIEQAKLDILSGKILAMNPATCHDVVQGTTQQITLTATGGQANYTYKLLLDGSQIATAGPIAATSKTFSVTFSQATGSHTLKGDITDSCATPKTSSDQCTFNITAATICTWITNNGGVSGITIPKIFNLVDAYIGVTNIGFIPTNQQIFGCVDYYLGFITSGNSKTGCSF